MASPPLGTALLGAVVAIILSRALYALPADREIAQYVRRSWTVEQGLPHGTVRGFAQTSDGYLWLATYEGLVRFNGEHFRIFDKTASPGIRNSSIRVVFRSRDDTLWAGTVAGLVRVSEGTITPVAGKGELGDNIVDALAESPDGRLWIGTEQAGVIVLHDDRFEKLPIELPSRTVNALASTTDGVWIGTAEGLFRYTEGRELERYTKQGGLASDVILTLLSDGEDAVYVGTTSGLNRIEDGRIEVIPGLPVDQVTALLRDRDGNLWVGTYANGLFRLRDDVVSSYGIGSGLLDPTVRAIFEDDEGSVWVGTNRGLEQLRVGRFLSWNHRHGLSDSFVRAVFEDRDGVIQVGTANGLNLRENGRWVKARDQMLTRAYVLSIAQGHDGTLWYGTSSGLVRSTLTATTLLTTADGLSNDTVRAIHEDRRGDIWIATDIGLNRIRPTGEIERIAGVNEPGTDYVLAIAETPDGRVWAATGGGLAEFDGSTFKLHSAPGELPSNRLFGLAAEDDGTLWIATDGDGLIRYRDGVTNVITRAHGLFDDKILSLTKDMHGRFWFGTVRGAFSVPVRDLNAVADGAQPMLVSTWYDESDGLGSRQCNGAGDPAVLRSRDGRIWFATANGVSVISPEPELDTRTPSRAPIIERVLVNGIPSVDRSPASLPPDTERLEIEFTGVTFVASDRMRYRYRLEGYSETWVDAGSSRTATYTKLPAGHYTFVLGASRDGDEWKTTSLAFDRQPRLYERRAFLVVAIGGIAALLIALHLMRLHMARARARLLATLVDERTQQIREEKARTELALHDAEAARREAERHERLAEQALADANHANQAKSILLATTSHELRTPLNAIIGFSGILIEKAGDELPARDIRFLQNIHSSGEYLLGIINNILDLSKIEAGRMEFFPEPIALGEVVDGIRTVMKGVTSLRRITFDVDIPGDLPLIDADPTQLKQILYNLMSNGAKFSEEESRVKVTARAIDPAGSPLGEAAIEFRVIDDGIGIDAKDHDMIFQEFRQAHGLRGRRPEGTGLGLALVKRFVEMHRGTIRVESEPGKGSTFIVVMPCRAVKKGDG